MKSTPDFRPRREPGRYLPKERRDWRLQGVEDHDRGVPVSCPPYGKARDEQAYYDWRRGWWDAYRDAKRKKYAVEHSKKIRADALEIAQALQNIDKRKGLCNAEQRRLLGKARIKGFR